MNEVRELTKRKLKENIFLGLLLSFFCILNIVFNISTFKKVILEEYTFINSYSTLEEAYKNGDKFLSIDLTNASLERYKLDKKADIYTLSLDKDILVFLKENTILTGRINVEISNDSQMIKEVKDKLKDNNYGDIVLSNINFNKDVKIEKYKAYTLVTLCILSILSVIINTIKNIKPEKTRYYKKLIKKYCK